MHPFARPSPWLAIRAPWKSQTQRTCWNWHKSGRNESLSSWWFQPTWKIWVKLDHFRRVRGENENYLKPLPSLCWRCWKSLMWTWFPLRTHFSDLLMSSILNLAQPKRHHPPKKGKHAIGFSAEKTGFRNSFVKFFEFISPPPFWEVPIG